MKRIEQCEQCLRDLPIDQLCVSNHGRLCDHCALQAPAPLIIGRAGW